MFEIQYDRKFHTVFLGLSCAVLSVSGAPAGLRAFYDLDDLATREISSIYQGALVVLIVQMYLSSAWRKIQAPHFLDGVSLSALFRHYSAVRGPQGRYPWYAGTVSLIDARDPEWLTALMKLAAFATVITEIVLPVMLLLPATWLAGVIAGSVFHVVISQVMPDRLPPFGLASVGGYVLFLEPDIVVSLLV